MNKILLMLALTVLLIGSSCKKVYNYPEGSDKEVYTVITDKSQIEDTSSWTIIEIKPFGKPEDPYWILQSGKSKVTVRNIYDYYWKPEYKEGKILSGAFVKSVY